MEIILISRKETMISVISFSGFRLTVAYDQGLYEYIDGTYSGTGYNGNNDSQCYSMNALSK